ncbi:O-antigen ligase family protein [Desulfomarina profundi]|uniref:O-antigen ligase family protein n=1 Tax=Desulfomarina profundi TaxID=2772557 RepID=UPI001E5B43E6|nr:O-antigen ligase family protein [Desulfomarina profundi]
MLAITILLTTVCLEGSKKIKVLLVGVLSFMLYATQSRTAMVALVASSLIGYLVSFRNIQAYIKVIVGFVLGIGCFYVMHGSITGSSIRLQVGLATFGGRLALWEQAYVRLGSSSFLNILLGHGFMLPNSWFHTGGLTTNSLHNGYLQVLFGTGLFGFFAYLLIWYSLVIAKKPPDTFSNFAFYSLLSFLFIFNFCELGSFVLVNSMSLTFLALIGISLDTVCNDPVAQSSYSNIKNFK